MNKLVIFLIIFPSFLAAQPQIQCRVGGSNIDIGHSIIQTSDGGYAIAGETDSYGAGNDDFYIVKLNPSGTIQWTRTVGGSQYERAYSIIQTKDGGYAVLGLTDSYGAGDYDLLLVKLSAAGALQWAKTIGGTSREDGYSIIQTPDSGYTLAGATSSFSLSYTSYYVVRLSSTGAMQWSMYISQGTADYAKQMIRTFDNGYTLIGTSIVAANYFIRFYHITQSGSFNYGVRLSGPASTDFVGNSVIQTSDSGYAIAGYTTAYSAGLSDGYIVKLNRNYAYQWSRTFGGTGYDEARSIFQTSNGSYVIAGNTDSYSGGTNFFLVRLYSDGSVQSSKTIGGTSTDNCNSMAPTSDKGFVMTGQTSSFGAPLINMYVVKVDSNRNTCANSTTQSVSDSYGAVLMSSSPTSGFVTSTITNVNPTTSSGGTSSIVCATGIEPVSGEVPKSYSLEQNYPNPFNPSTKIRFSIPQRTYAKITVYDLLGNVIETIASDVFEPGIYETEWNAEKFSSGIYYYSLTTESYTETRKLVYIK